MSAFDAGPLVDRGPKDHINMRILQTMVSGISLSWALEPESRIYRILTILTFTSYLGPPVEEVGFCRARDGRVAGLSTSQRPVRLLPGNTTSCPNNKARRLQAHILHQESGV